ncbi:hemicentin-1-like isoform X2 [Pararge aegeria]|uniref:hemicentin-1-like isoform X2 n=1 Tax=Pararge aegeria TaxID=116150 RepID=UPI0019D085BD|nr:hemicentin-1-like isoform X2 [Pararge aegeria]
MTGYKDIFVLLYLLYMHWCFVEGAVKSSLVFVIDDTYSMSEEISQVKQKTFEVFDAVLSSNGSTIDDFVLVTFNDPDAELRIVTRDKYAYKREVEGIIVHGGDDCEEFAMAGIELALENSKPNSFLYVFTDASAKDHHNFERVKSLSQKKSTQITFLLTGVCDGRKTPDYLVFEKLAEATSGQVFNIERDDVKKVIDYIIASIKHKKTTLGQKNFRNSDEAKNMTFTVDSKVWDVMVSMSAASPEFHVLGPNSTEVTVEKLMNTSTTYVVKLITTPGLYTIVLDKDINSPTSVVVTGSTSVTFQHGFSTFIPSTINDTSTKPIPDQPSFLSIELDNNNKDVILKTVELRDQNDNVISDLPLKMINEEQQLYATEAFKPPSLTFKILIQGYTPTGEKIIRVAPTTVEYQNPSILAETIKDMPPKVTISEESTVYADFDKPLTLYCKVMGYPKPDISWQDSTGTHLPSTVNVIELPYEYVSILHIAKVENNVSVTCEAKNDFGEDSDSVNIKMKYFLNVLEHPSEPPRIDKSVTDYHVQKGTAVNLLCRIISGKPEPEFHWAFDQNFTDTFEPRFISSIGSNNENSYHIESVDPKDSGVYRCLTRNEIGEDVHDIYLFVEYPPVVAMDDEEILFKEGEIITIPCSVNGAPTPSVRWLVDELEIGASNRYKIYRDNTLSFRGSVHDRGIYTCEASNPLGKSHKDVRLDIYVPVKIESPKRSIIDLREGYSLILPCNADGYPEPYVKWVYFSKDPKIAPRTLQPDNQYSIMIKEVNLRDEGFYTCVASNINSIANITYEVNVKAPPTIVNSLQDKTINVVKGDLALRLPCGAVGNPKPAVSWKFDNGLNVVTGVAVEKYDVLVNDSPSPDSNGTTAINLEENHTLRITCRSSDMKIGQLIRWYKDGRLIVEDNDLVIKNASLTDSGIYSCRESNFRESHSSHFHVIVGYAPKFTFEEETNIEFIEGSFTALSCDADAQPKPKVHWWKKSQSMDETSMDYILSMELSDIGHYTCMVGNEFGTISRTFNIINAKECVLNIDNNFKMQQPLLLSTEELPALHGAVGQLRIPASHSMLMICPNTFINIDGINYGDNLKGSCINGSIFDIDGRYVDFSDIRCNDKVVPLTKNTGIACGPGYTELLKIGYNVGVEFMSIYDVCFDKRLKLPLYAKHDINPMAADSVPNESIDYVKNKHLPFEFDDMYNCGQQRDSILFLTGKRLSTNNRCCFAKRQLVNPRDVITGYQQVATYNYLNVIPKWGTCGTENWDNLEERVRSLVKALDHPLEVYTGSSHLMKLPAQTKERTVRLTDRFGRKQPVPRYIWKVIINHYEAQAVAIIQINIPDITIYQAFSFMLCKDMCHKIEWMRNGEWRDVKKGFTFCCNVKEFETKFGYKDLFKIRELSSKALII